MDKFKGVAKGGWHPGGDRSIHRDTWKSDLKGIATGKKNDPNEAARNHQSAPLSSLKDPDSFGPPPKHTAYHGNVGTQSQSSPTTVSSPAAGGWGAAVPASKPRQSDANEQAPKPALPYRVDTTGLRTDNLPRPPARSTASVAPGVVPTSSPSLPPRQTPNQALSNNKPPPMLPPRQNDSPSRQAAIDAPPSYTTATQPLLNNSNLINQDAVGRLGRSGIAVPGLGIGTSSQGNATQPKVNAAQLGELQQRFARINNVPSGDTVPAATSQQLLAAAHKKAPPPPPKKVVLNALANANVASSTAPPPIPLSSKPKP